VHNVIQQKYAMRDWLTKHSKTAYPMNFKSEVWGINAQRNAWRVTKAATGDGSTRRAILEDVLWPPTFGEMVVRVAMGELGVKENPPGSNSGPRIDMYLRNAGIPTNWPASDKAWCASGAKWCYDEARKRLGLRPIKWFWNPAGVPQWTKAAHDGQLMRAIAFGDARQGDYVCLWGSGHIEIVVKRVGDYLYCVGFNTSPVGQNANGGMVANTKRHRSEVTVIGRPHN
jgi:hypothetical protein